MATLGNSIILLVVGAYIVKDAYEGWARRRRARAAWHEAYRIRRDIYLARQERMRRTRDWFTGS